MKTPYPLLTVFSELAVTAAERNVTFSWDTATLGQFELVLQPVLLSREPSIL